MKSRNWSFTINNYTESEYEKVCEEHKQIEYLCVGKEKGEKGTPHLQGFVRFKNTVTLAFVKEWAPRCHAEICKGTAEQNITYCTKDNNYFERGERPKSKPNINNRWNELLDLCKTADTYEEVLDMYPGLAIRYKHAIQEIIAASRNQRSKESMKQNYSEDNLKGWQRKVIKKLKNQNDRQVLWVWDAAGGIGKSWLANYLCLVERAFLIEGGKSADIAYAWDMQEYVVFDLVRAKQETINYAIIESFKNGRVFSSKYQSSMKIRNGGCKVVVFANWAPDTSSMSLDRWDILNIKKA